MRSKYRKSSREYADNYWFGGNKIKTLERDGYKCVKCGINNEDHKIKYKRGLTVDHIDGKGCKTPKEERNNDLNNLQTLCCGCHGRKDIARLNPPKPIWQMTLNNRKIQMFNSVTEASIKMNYSLGSLGLCLTGKRRTANGFKWRYANNSV